MEIGERLKKARNDIGMTQEKVAAEIGVSRQSVSNRENNRAYPDIVSVIKLSDLYSVSLDELLKEDKKMIRHLAETTEAAASNRRYARWILLGVYAVVWVMFIPFFWLAVPSDLLNSEREVYMLFYPLCTGITAALIGSGGHFGMWKWLYIPINGIMCILSYGVTWDLYYYLSDLGVKEYMTKTEQPFVLFDFLKEYLNKTEWYEKGAPIVGITAAAVGLFIGSFIHYYRISKATQTNGKAFLQENSPL